MKLLDKLVVLDLQEQYLSMVLNLKKELMEW
jgi:hypothetical protein